MDEFELFVKDNIDNVAHDFRQYKEKYISMDISTLHAVWLEATRQADRKARIECAEICRDVHRNYECSRIGADLCKHAISATIKEPPA